METRFVEYETEETLKMMELSKTFDDKYKGIIVYFIDGIKPHYEYAPFSVSYEEYLEWEKNF